MGRKLIFDIESNGLLDKMDRIHCIVARDVETRETFRFRHHDGYWHDVDFATGVSVPRTGPPENNIAEGVRFLEEADLLIAHNGCGFDIHAIRKLFPAFDPPRSKVRDTLVLSRVICPDVEDGDYRLNAAGKLPGQLIGSYSLDAWGYRVGLHKGDYSKQMLKLNLDPWAEWSPAMEDYCVTPENRLLGSDLRWRPAHEFNVGDVVLGFDEHGRGRKYRKAVIESKRFEVRPVFEVVFDTGERIRTTAEHRWLVSHINKKGQNATFDWVETRHLRPGMSKVSKMLNVWEEDPTREAGWLAGMFDGEGSLQYRSGRGVSISQNPGPVLDRIIDGISRYSTYGRTSKRRVNSTYNCEVVRILGGLANQLEFLGRVRPERLIAKIDFDQMGRMECRNTRKSVVVAINPLPPEEIIKLQTSSRTFICEGFPMHNCVNDVDVTEVVWAGCMKDMPPELCVDLEHQTHDICLAMERNGYFFDEEGARKLCVTLEETSESLSNDVKAAFGYWYAPAKKYHIRPVWDDPDGINKEKFAEDQRKPPEKQKFHKPRTEWGEDDSRPWWAEFQFPKKNRRSKKLGDLTEGAPYSPIKRIDFNPGSRPQIIDRFQQLYDWKPEEFTEAGNPSCNDAEIRKLSDRIPEAEPIAEILFHKKLIGMISTGKLSWLSCLKPDGMIHAHTNCGGTVSGRAAHNHPNIGQVPAVVENDCLLKDGSLNPKLCGPDGVLLPHCFKIDGTMKKKAPLLGREGEYGWECRKLFYTPGTMIYVGADGQEYEEEWAQLGVDLSGIELRCLAEQCADFDGGELIEVVLSGDPHQYNMDKTGIKSRDLIKRVLYGLMYGAGDWKIGHTADPLLTDAQKSQLGAEIRATLMRGLPALQKAIERVQREAERGYLIGLDGRKLKCRAAYSALNLRLQSDAALIAKKWLCLTEEYLFADGLDHGWTGDFALLAWVHDEIQNAVKKVHIERAAELTKLAATEAGKFFNYRCRIDAAHKIGHDWAECH
jgi:hypothetical protein